MSVVNLNRNKIRQLHLMREMIEKVLLIILFFIFDSNSWSISFEDCGSDYFRQGAGKLKNFPHYEYRILNVIYERIRNAINFIVSGMSELSQLFT